MAFTETQIITRLIATEPDLVRLAQEVTPADLGLAQTLLASSDERVRANAYTLISLASPTLFLQVAARGASDTSPLVRMQVAAASNNLNDADLDGAASILETLLQDADHGVRKFALRTGARSQAQSVQSAIQRMVDSDAHEFLRTQAADVLRRRRR